MKDNSFKELEELQNRMQELHQSIRVRRQSDMKRHIHHRGRMILEETFSRRTRQQKQHMIFLY